MDTENIRTEYIHCKTLNNCNFKCRKKESMIQHWTSHLEDDIYWLCDNCHYKVKSSFDLKNHIKKGIHLKAVAPVQN